MVCFQDYWLFTCLVFDNPARRKFILILGDGILIRKEEIFLIYCRSELLEETSRS